MRLASIVPNHQLTEICRQLSLGIAQGNRRYLLLVLAAIRENEILRAVANPQANRDVTRSIFVATVVITVGQKAAYRLTPSILIMKADARIVNADELDVVTLLDVEQPSSLTNRIVCIAVHVDRAIDVNPYRVNSSRARRVDGVAQRRRDLTFGRLKYVAARLGDLDGLVVGLLKRQYLRLHPAWHDLRLGAGHRWRCHERACHGCDTQQTRQRSAHPHLLLLHRSAPLTPMLSR